MYSDSGMLLPATGRQSIMLRTLLKRGLRESSPLPWYRPSLQTTSVTEGLPLLEAPAALPGDTSAPLTANMWSMDTNCNAVSLPNMAAMKTEPYIPNSSTDNAMGMPQKEVCRGCHRQIEDRFLLRVMDNSWHEQCLQCSVCQEALSRSCFVKDGKLFCKHDYDKLYGVRCCGCLQSIPSTEFVMRALGNVYHVRCFVCVACGHQLQKGDQFVVKDGRIFCRLDFEKEFAMMQMSPKNEWCPAFSPKSDEDSSVDENDVEAPKGPKRPRTILTTSQRRKFKASFEINPKPCRKVRETLASETGLSVRVVQVWFQNQRAKMKKLARRQTDGQGSGDSKKNGNGNSQKQTAKRKKDDDGSDTSTTPSDSSNIAALPSNSENRPHYDNQLTPFNNNTQEMYSSNSVGENMYNNNMSIDGSLENIEDVLINQGNQQNNGGSGPVVNPIDKLYSMQSSYFSTD